jgi:hypothetical protein
MEEINNFQSAKLWAVSPENLNIIWKDSSKSEILVTAWTSNKIYSTIARSEKENIPQLTKTEEGARRTLIFDTWVTLAPQIKEFFRRFRIASINFDALLLTKRLQQYLGLPNYPMTHFVEMWVNTTTIFRPCLDPQINTESCKLAPNFTINAAHEKWMKNAKEQGDRNNLPFTGLGYTYDLGSKTHIGASEYVIRAGAEVTINTVMTTEEYLV